MDKIRRTECNKCKGVGFIEVSELAWLRENSGYTQMEVAEILGLSRISVSNIERGIQTPSILKIRELAQVYEVPTDTLIEAILATQKPAQSSKGKEK